MEVFHKPQDFSSWIEQLYSNISLIQKYVFTFNLFFQFGKYESAFKVANQGLILAENSKNNGMLREFLVNLGEIFEVRFEYDVALMYYFKALKILLDSEKAA